MRPRRVVAGMALIVLLASVVVPGVAGALASGREPVAEAAFRPVTLDPERGTSTTTVLDPINRASDALEPNAAISDPLAAAALPERPVGVDPAAPRIVVEAWKLDPNISWYGPGFYGNGGACGMIPGGLTPDTIGVAHKTLPCGTKVTFKWNGKVVVARVIDRGPYVAGRQFDMTHGLCAALNHCFTGWIWYRIG